MGLFSIFRPRQAAKLEQQGPATKKGKTGSSRKDRRGLTWRSMAAVVILMVWSVNALIYLQRSEVQVDYVEGQVAPESIYAELNFDYVDKDQTAFEKRQAEDAAHYIFRFERGANERVRQNFRELFQTLESWDPESEPQTERQHEYKTYGPENLLVLKNLVSDQTREDFFMEQLKQVQLSRIVPQEAKQGSNAQRQIMIVNEQLDHAQIEDLAVLYTPRSAAETIVEQMAEAYGGLTPDQRDALANGVLAEIIEPNTRFDQDRTAALQQKARDEVQDVMKQYKKGEPIIVKGTVITDNHLDLLREYATTVKAEHRGQEFWIRAATMSMLGLILITVWGMLLHVSQPQVTRRMGNLLLIGVTVSLNLLLVWGVQAAMLAILALVHGAQPLVYAALPLAFTAILLSLLLNPSAAMISGMLVAVLLGLNSADSPANALNIMMLGVMSSVVGALAVKSARTRIQTFRTMVYVPVAVAAAETIYLLMNAVPWSSILVMLALVVVNVLVVTVLVNLLLPFLEVLFSITTNISLLEMSDLNHPLLKRLQLEAPGTFHHTMNVATLAEHAAEGIGANTLLCRVASYFHDVGKLSNPSYFTENNIDEKNQHDDKTPYMSARIIVNHVKEGLELAKQYKLRPPIRNAIATHHGTSLVFFFFHRAKQESTEGARVEEAPFRYPGPLPRTRESTIISIADSCEAASRSLSKPTPQKIDAMVNEIVRNRMLDGQLDESELTMDELNRVVAVIKKTLHTMRHARIAYPKDEEDPLAKTRKMTPGVDPEKTQLAPDHPRAKKKERDPDESGSAPLKAGSIDDVDSDVIEVEETVVDVSPPGASARRPEMKTTVIASREALAALAARDARLPVLKPELPAALASASASAGGVAAPRIESAVSAPPAAGPPAAAHANGSLQVAFSNDQDDVPVTDEPLLLKLLQRGLELGGLTRRQVGTPGEVSFALVDLKTIEEVNVRHLDHEGPTDVITFDYSGDVGPADPDADDEPPTIGEVMVCPAVAIRQAAEHQQDLATEMVLYLVHGILHLSGHTDLQDADRAAMRQAESDVLSALRGEFDFARLFGEPAGDLPG